MNNVSVWPLEKGDFKLINEGKTVHPNFLLQKE